METELNANEILVSKYLEQLNDKERKVLEIAKEHLGTSFHILKSVGYINWKKGIK
jgi:hypothetical protein